MTSAAIIGGGHNGLVTAALLAEGGVDTTVYEARSALGGMAAVSEFAPGFRAPGPALFFYQLAPAVLHELTLQSTLAKRASLDTVVLSDGAAPIVFNRTAVLRGLPEHDVQAYRGLMEQMRRFGGLLETLYARRPPKLKPDTHRERFALARLGLDLRRLGRDDLRALLRVGAGNVYDVFNEWLTTDALKGALALDGTLGSHLGPRSGNTVLNFMHRLSGAPPLVHAAGGENLIDALREVAEQRGVKIRTEAPVAQVVVKRGRASGIVLESGEIISADRVVSNLDVRATVLSLVGARHFDAGFIRRVHHIRCSGNVARLDLALAGMPSVNNLNENDLAQRLVIAPTMDHVENAFNPAKYGQWSDECVMEFGLPTLIDPSLAPSGQHVLSASVQYVPYELKEGWTDAAKTRLTEQLLDQLERYLPGLRQQVVSSRLQTPLDLEYAYGVSGGHWHHGELSLDQFLFVRPTYGAERYALPVDGLYLCGASTHPGGGVSGAAGRNCAREILREVNAR
ncbi:MAG: NAD(P)/FAD-dependent oxidoreductase [Pseudomonadota bacterium]